MTKFYVQFLMTQNDTLVDKWTSSDFFFTKEDAQKFAQNTSKGFNGSKYNLFYRIIN